MNRRRLTLLTLLLGGAMLMMTPPAAARDLTGRIEAGPFVGGYIFDDDLRFDDGVILGGRVGYRLTRDLAGEVSLGYVPTESDVTETDASLFQIHLDGLYHFDYFGGRFVPFLAAGVGGALYNVDHDGGSDWDWLVNYGLGAKYWITDTIAARLDLRQPITFDGMNHHFMYTIGLSWLLGAPPAAPPAPAPAAPPKPAPAPPPVKAAPPPPAPVRAPAPTATLTANPATIQQGQSSTLSWTTRDAREVSIEGIGAVSASGSRSVTPGENTTYRLVARGEGGSQEATARVTVVAAPPIDSDRDGVPDDRDKCPNTPEGARVDAQGCPLDSDRDGVADYLDKCPGTPAGVKVDAQGCPPDSDGDGVPDYLDKCPNTPRGMKVDAEGCSVEKLRITLQIQFDTAKADIKPAYDAELAGMADFMKKYPQTNVVIEGHTDNVGGMEYNMDLSRRRADAVKKYLVEKFGISTSRIATKGFGPTRPIADNKTPEGRAKNRRIEAVVDEVIIRK